MDTLTLQTWLYAAPSNVQESAVLPVVRHLQVHGWEVINFDCTPAEGLTPDFLAQWNPAEVILRGGSREAAAKAIDAAIEEVGCYSLAGRLGTTLLSAPAAIGAGIEEAKDTAIKGAVVVGLVYVGLTLALIVGIVLVARSGAVKLRVPLA